MILYAFKYMEDSNIWKTHGKIPHIVANISPILRKNVSNNIQIPIKYPPNGWGKPNTWSVGQPAGEI